MLPAPTSSFNLEKNEETCAPLISAQAITAITAITSNQEPDWPVLAKTHQISWSPDIFLARQQSRRENPDVEHSNRQLQKRNKDVWRVQLWQ